MSERIRDVTLCRPSDEQPVYFIDVSGPHVELTAQEVEAMMAKLETDIVNYLLGDFDERTT